LHDALQHAIAAVHDAAAHVATAADGAIASLESVPGRARETALAVGKVLPSLRQEALRLDAARVALFEGLHTSVDAFNEDYRDLTHGIEDYMKRVTKAFQDALMELHAMPSHATDLGLITFHRVSQVKKEVDQLGSVAEQHAAQLVKAMDHGSQA